MKEKKRFSWEFTPGFFLILFWAAFGAGVLGMNLLWEACFQQGSLMGLFLLFRSVRGDWEPGKYFWYVLKYRCGWLLVCMLASSSVWGLLVSFLSVALPGFLLGMLVTLSILEFGILGLAGGAALVFPQILCYFPAVIWLMSGLARKSSGYLKKNGRFSKSPGTDRRFLTGCIFLYLAGVLLESFVNPMVLEFVLSHMGFF